MLMIMFAVAKGISLIQTVIIARYLGVGSDWDAYVTANRIPELIVVLISGGALGHAFIPIFSGFLARQDHQGAYRLASHILNSVFAAALLISMIIFILAPYLVAGIIAPGFSPETQAQTVTMMRLLLVGTMLFSVSGIFSGILQSHNHFLLPAVAPIMYDLGILFGVMVLLQPLGIYGVALGTVLGAALHLGIQIPGLIHHKARWFRELGLSDPNLRRVITLMIPRIVGLGVFQFNFIVMTSIASRLGEGAVSALDWGWRLMQIPETLIGTAMGIVIFPTLAALSEVRDEQGKRTAMTAALRFILISSIPSAVGLILIGRPLLSLLEGGAFTGDDARLIYGTLSAFTLGLIVHSLLEVIARSFYADQDTRTPLWAALGGAAINLTLSLALTGILISPNPPLENVTWLALANSLGVMFEVIVLSAILRRRWHGIEESSLLITTGKTIASTAIMALVVVGVGSLIHAGDQVASGISMRTILNLAIQVSAGAAAFVASALILRMQEIRQIIGILRNRKTNTAQIGAETV
jgi:putative peptidoglycan lipid II flippase